MRRGLQPIKLLLKNYSRSYSVISVDAPDNSSFMFCESPSTGFFYWESADSALLSLKREMQPCIQAPLCTTKEPFESEINLVLLTIELLNNF